MNSAKDEFVNEVCDKEDRRHSRYCAATTSTYDTLSGIETHRCYSATTWHVTDPHGKVCMNLCRSHANKFRRKGFAVTPIDIDGESSFWRWYVYSSPLTLMGYFWIVAIFAMFIFY